MMHQTKRGKVIILSGPSGVGKTTLHKELLANKSLARRIVKSVSVTTRPRRRGEVSGRDYFFLTPGDFFKRRAAGEFLEWKKVFDNFYATPQRHLEKTILSGKSVLLCIDVEGAKVVQRAYPKAVTIFVLPPTMTVLKERLQRRASENDSGLKLRLQTARKEMKEAPKYKYVVVNDQLTKAVKSLESIILNEVNPT